MPEEYEGQGEAMKPIRNGGGAPRGDEASFRTMEPVRGGGAPAQHAADAVEDLVGTVLGGRYEVVGVLGQGGMGVVYRCQDRLRLVYRCQDRLARKVYALKSLPPEISRSEDEMEELVDNFGLVGGLTHPNIVAMRHIEQFGGRAYLLMDCVEGSSLRSWARARRRAGELTLDAVVSVVRQVARALDYAHGKGVVHRDIKPGNIMVTAGGEAKLLDFGLAALVRSSMSRVSMRTMDVSGTAPYMSPEQWRGHSPHAASDQYALGVVVYELLSGHLPFENPDKEILVRCVLNEPPEPLEGVPQHVSSAVMRALSKDHRDRFPCCAAFADALAGGGQETAASGTSGAKPQQDVMNGANVTIQLPGNVTLDLVKIKAGSFMMGSPAGEDGRGDDETRHRVTLTQDFWLGKYAVTQAQWEAVMGNNPSFFKKGGDYPVEMVSWEDAQDFCRKLNELHAGELPSGYRFGLPTEAQWEYACRAGTTTAFHYGDASDARKMNHDGNYPCGGGGKGAYLRETTPVGSYAPNAWGLYDMHGNVVEWCEDWYGPYGGDGVDPRGADSGSYRVFRGGGWNDGVGFRLALRPIH